MNRAERRRNQKQEYKAKVRTYVLTEEQLNLMVKERIGKEVEKAKEEAMEEAVNTAMTLLLTLPLEVLMDHYWQKSYKKRLPGFVDHVLQYYEMWQDGKIEMDDLREDLWTYGGIKLAEGESSESGREEEC